MRNYIVFILLLASQNTYCQRERKIADSLLPKLASVQQNMPGIDLYNSLSAAYLTMNTDSCFIFSNKGMALSASLHQDSFLMQFKWRLSTILTDTGNYTLALKYAQESLDIAKHLRLQNAIAGSYLSIGRVYDFQNDFVHSADYFFKAMTVARNIHNHAQMALIGTNLSAAFINQGDNAKAEKYALETVQEGTIANTPIHVYKAYNILGMIKAIVHDTASAIMYYNKAIYICRKNGFILNEAEVETDLSNIVKDDTARIGMLLHARKIFDARSPSSFNSRINWQTLGNTYLDMFIASPKQRALLKKAQYYLSIFIAKSQNANDVMSAAQGLQKMAEAEALAGNYKMAYRYSNQYHAINDSVFSQDNKNKVAALESRDEVDKKNQEIATQKLQVQEERRNIALLVGGLVVSLLIGFLFYRLSTLRKQQNNRLNKLNNELDEANKLKDRFFGILSHDLRTPVSNLINFLTLRQKKPSALSEQQVTEHETKMGKAAQALLETMENLLLWSKSQMQHFKPEIQPVPVAALYNYLQNNFANEEHIQFVFTDQQHVIINTDENFLKTIIYNLTANAVKALRNSQNAKIQWHARTEGGSILLSITDNGPGIDRSKIKALYDETSVSSARDGMGLHIIRDISKAIGCTIKLNDDVLSGTQFILTFAKQ